MLFNVIWNDKSRYEKLEDYGRKYSVFIDCNGGVKMLKKEILSVLKDKRTLLIILLIVVLPIIDLSLEYKQMNEEARNIYEVLDLGFGKCRMCICGPKESKELLQHHELIRVATKYPRIAKDYFYNKKHQTVEIIKLNGSIELAPIVGLAEVICDIVETGSTLRENGLEVLEEVCPLSARMVVNQVSMKMEHERITKLITDLKSVLKEA